MSKLIVTWVKQLRFAADLQDISVWPYFMQRQRSREC